MPSEEELAEWEGKTMGRVEGEWNSGKQHRVVKNI